MSVEAVIQFLLGIIGALILVEQSRSRKLAEKTHQRVNEFTARYLSDEARREVLSARMDRADEMLTDHEHRLRKMEGA